MALLGNRTILNRILGRQFYNIGASYSYMEAMSPVSSRRNRHIGGVPKYTSTPNAYLHPMALVLPQIAGGMATNNQVQIAIAQSTAVLVNAQYITGSSTITLTLVDASLGQIFAGIASGTITVAQATADLKALVAAGATGTITFAVNTAGLGGKFSMDGASTITITPSGLLTAIAFMEASAGGATPLSPEGLANAVWSASKTEFNAAGTMGEALNDAGSAGNPWAADISTNNTEGTFGWFVQKLLKFVTYLGLK
jgi:hypothetical protein